MPFDRATASYDPHEVDDCDSTDDALLVYHLCGCARKNRFSPGSKTEEEFIRMVQGRPCRRHRHVALIQ